MHWYELLSVVVEIRNESHLKENPCGTEGAGGQDHTSFGSQRNDAERITILQRLVAKMRLGATSPVAAISRVIGPNTGNLSAGPDQVMVCSPSAY